MTVYVLTAVHNRCETTHSFLRDIFNQNIHEPVRIVIVDDGSSDGTNEMLREQARSTPSNITLTILEGTGSLWWAEAMARAVEFSRPYIKPDDVVVFMNDDISVPQTTVSALASTCRLHGCITKAILRQVDDPASILDRGAMLDVRTLSVLPLPLDVTGEGLTGIDVAPGRTVAFPGVLFVRGLNVNFKQLPHHLADLEFSIRASREGFPIYLAEEICTYSINDVSQSRSPLNPIRRLTHISSSDRLLSYWAFWRTAAPHLPKLTLFIRFIRYLLLPNILTSVPCFARWMDRRRIRTALDRRST